MEVLYDQMQRQLKVDLPPKRVISLVPSQTELLVDLGLEERLVGVTKFCVHPAGIRKKATVVGGTKQVKMEKIRALQPDLILCNKEENTRAMVEELAAEFTVHVSDVNTLEESYEMIRQYGQLLKVDEKAAALIDEITREVREFTHYIADKPRLTVAYFIWRNPWMVVGSSTFVNYLLQLNKLDNVYADIPRYPEVNLEELKPVEVMLLSSEPFPFKEKHQKELEPYAPQAAFSFVDGEYFSWYGSRLAAAFRYFRKWRETLEVGR